MISETLRNIEYHLRTQGYRIALILAATVALPGLIFGLFIDDYVHLLSLMGRMPVTRPPFDLFLFAPGDPEVMRRFLDVVQFPWFTDPEVKIHFFRPLSSWLMYMDYALFGEQFWAYHLHSLLWYVGLCGAAALLYRRLLPLSLAIPALLLFVLDEGHMIPTYWWSNRNALVSALPALLALLAHIQWRDSGQHRYLCGALFLLALGFLGSEGALAVTAYFGAYELFGRTGPWRGCILALVPAALLSVAYLLAYKVAGFGVAHSGIYLDPMAEPLNFLREGPGRLVMLIASQMANVPVEGGVLEAALETPLLIASLCATLLVAGLLYWSWPSLAPAEKQVVRWLLIGALLSAAPSLATFPSSRLLLLPSLGGAVAVAVILRHAWRQMRNGHAASRCLVYVLVVLHAGIPALVWIATPGVIRLVNDRFIEITTDAPLGPAATDTTYIFVNAPDPMLGVYTPLVRDFHGYARPQGWYTLVMTPLDLALRRPDARSLDIEVLNGEILGSLFERLFRTEDNPLKMGDRIPLRGMALEITEMGTRGPTRLQLESERDFDGDAYQFLVWKDLAIQRIDPPAIGEEMIVPAGPGFLQPLSLMGLR